MVDMPCRQHELSVNGGSGKTSVYGFTLDISVRMVYWIINYYNRYNARVNLECGKIIKMCNLV